MARTELPFTINEKDYRRAGLGRLDNRKLKARDLVLNTLNLKSLLEIKQNISKQASETRGRNVDVILDTGPWLVSKARGGGDHRMRV